MLIRECLPEDAAEIARLHAQSAAYLWALGYSYYEERDLSLASPLLERGFCSLMGLSAGD